MDVATVNHQPDPAAWAASLGVSRDAIDIYLASDVIDLHVDSFIWTRIFGYDLTKRHGLGVLGGRLFSQVDLPRMRQAQVSGAMWSITTWPFRKASGRASALASNVNQLGEIFARASDAVSVVRNASDYHEAQEAGRHAAFLVVQGGDALGDDPRAMLDHFGDVLVRVTLVHLSHSAFGSTSARLRKGNDLGLSTRGAELVEALNHHRVFVDLAHISPRGFSDACSAHDKTQPLLVTHTGVNEVHRSWRNLDDTQLRAVAQTGGVIGAVFHSLYLNGTLLGRARASDIARHIKHIIDVVGDDHAAIGSDFDGLIVPPADLRSCLELPRLVQALLDSGVRDDVIPKVLGGNFLRVLTQLRG